MSSQSSPVTLLRNQIRKSHELSRFNGGNLFELPSRLRFSYNMTMEDDRTESPPKANSTEINETLIVSDRENRTKKICKN